MNNVKTKFQKIIPKQSSKTINKSLLSKWTIGPSYYNQLRRRTGEAISKQKTARVLIAQSGYIDQMWSSDMVEEENEVFGCLNLLDYIPLSDCIPQIIDAEREKRRIGTWLTLQSCLISFTRGAKHVCTSPDVIVDKQTKERLVIRSRSNLYVQAGSR